MLKKYQTNIGKHIIKTIMKFNADETPSGIDGTDLQTEKSTWHKRIEQEIKVPGANFSVLPT